VRLQAKAKGPFPNEKQRRKALWREKEERKKEYEKVAR